MNHRIDYFGEDVVRRTKQYYALKEKEERDMQSKLNDILFVHGIYKLTKNAKEKEEGR